MAEHKISAYFNQPIDVVNSDLEIVVKKNNKTFWNPDDKQGINRLAAY